MEIIDSYSKREKEIQDLGKRLRDSVDDLLEHPDVAGYALVVWTSDYAAAADWDSQYTTLPGACVPEFAKQALQTRLNDLATQDILDERVD